MRTNLMQLDEQTWERLRDLAVAQQVRRQRKQPCSFSLLCCCICPEL